MSIYQRHDILRSGQAAVEFMIFFGVLMAVTTVLVYNSHLSIARINEEKSIESIQDEIGSIRSMIDTIYLSGNGFSANMSIPERIAGKDYGINITNGFLVINISGNLRTERLITDNITGTIQKGPNTISNINNKLVIT